MPRFLVAILAMALASSLPLAAQSDTLPSPSTGEAATSPVATAFRDGQWAARFTVSGGFYGAGALLFTSPNAAWMIDATFSAQGYDYTDSDVSSEQESIRIAIGRRWYGAAHSRVRPTGGAGIQGTAIRVEQNDGFGTRTGKLFSGGVYGELGAAVFFAPELSLGASWRADLEFMHLDEPGVNGLHFSAGEMTLEGAFYF